MVCTIAEFGVLESSAIGDIFRAEDIGSLPVSSAIGGEELLPVAPLDADPDGILGKVIAARGIEDVDGEPGVGWPEFAIVALFKT
jgi:hypothetical protein